MSYIIFQFLSLGARVGWATGGGSGGRMDDSPGRGDLHLSPPRRPSAPCFLLAARSILDIWHTKEFYGHAACHTRVWNSILLLPLPYTCCHHVWFGLCLLPPHAFTFSFLTKINDTLEAQNKISIAHWIYFKTRCAHFSRRQDFYFSYYWWFPARSRTPNNIGWKPIKTSNMLPARTKISCCWRQIKLNICADQTHKTIKLKKMQIMLDI